MTEEDKNNLINRIRKIKTQVEDPTSSLTEIDKVIADTTELIGDIERHLKAELARKQFKVIE